MVLVFLIKNNKLCTFVLTFFLFAPFLLAQQNAINGFILDETNNPLEFASVTLLKTKDSIAEAFSFTNEKGAFTIADIQSDHYILQVYLTGFLPFYQNIEYKNQSIDLKNISLKTAVNKLNEVTITAVIPVQIKKDTISYNASSFKIHHDDNIEDLLKKLPGIELDNQGNIVSQGNEVTKIYVDGKEFFSGDPAIVLKNLSADMINKVEVIDKKSDEAELTGIRDEQKNYVINLTLKKNKKNNGFGKFSAGIGLKDKYFSNINYNKFSSKSQISVIGKINNINISGSNIQDFLSASGGLTDEEGDDTTIEQKINSLSGNLTTGVGGFNIGHELKKKETLNADYFYNFLENDGTSQRKQISFSRLRNYYSESENSTSNNSKNHNVNFNYENKSNKNSRLFLKGYINSEINTNNLDKTVSYFDDLNELKTENDINYYSKKNKDKGNVQLNYYKKINNTKRNFSTGFSIYSDKLTNFNDQISVSTNKTNNYSYKNAIIKNELFKNNNLNLNFTYTEPLGKNHYLKARTVFTLKNALEETEQNKKKNDIDQPSISYILKSKEESYQSTFIYTYSSEKFNLNINSELQQLYRDFGLEDENNYKIKKSYFNPSATFNYKPKKGENYVLKYRKYVKSPSNYKSSPVVNDLNPYYIRKGNPLLNSEKYDDITLNANLHNFQSGVTFFSKLGYQKVTNAIVPNLTITDNYIQTRSFVNEGNRDQYYSEFNLNKRLKSLDLRYNIKAKSLHNSENSIIDSELNRVISNEYLVGLSLENNNKNSIDIKLGADYSINNTAFSVIKNLNRNYSKQHYFTKIDYDISKRLNINSQFDYYLYSDSDFNSQQKIPFLNASIAYLVSQKNNAILKLLFIDILDKNVEIVRKSNINYFEETTNQTLGRYFILSFSLRLNNQNNNKTTTI